jgi:SAM-dependent methyltransferase
MAHLSLAPAYSATGAAWQHGPARIYDRLAEVLVAETAPSLAGRLVLDVGAGTGAASRAIRSAGGRPIALDDAAGMLTVDRGRRPPAVVADARRLPIATGTVGAVVAAFAYNHVPNPEAALADAARVLRSDGFVLASVYADDDQHPAKGAVEVAAREAGWRPERWVDDLTRAMPLLATPERAVAAAERAGLAASATVVSVAFPHLRATDLVAWRLGMASLAPFVAALPAGRRQALRDRALELVGEPETLVRRMVVLRAARC